MNTYPTPQMSVGGRMPGQPMEQDFTQLSQHMQTVEYLTVSGFLRRLQHRWHLDEITRFGSRVGKAADSLQMSYLTTVDQSLGPVRIFPLPFLTRIYQIMAPQFGWPRIMEVEPPSIGDQRKLDEETLRCHEKAAKCLMGIQPLVADPGVQHSFREVLAWLQADCDRIRQRMGGGAS